MSEYDSQKISDLLKKYVKIVPKDILIKDFLIEYLKEDFSVNLKSSQISISGNSIHIKANSVVKNVIFLNRNEVLRSISEKFKDSNIINIQ